MNINKINSIALGSPVFRGDESKKEAAPVSSSDKIAPDAFKIVSDAQSANAKAQVALQTEDKAKGDELKSVESAEEKAIKKS